MQGDDERRPLTQDAFDIDTAMMGLDQGMHDGESQSGSLFFGREEGIKNA